MLHVQFVSLLPEIFESFLATSILGRATEQQRVKFHHLNPRAFGLGRHRSVDDTPAGGGSGMVLRADVWVPAIEAARAEVSALAGSAHVILLTPQGQRFAQRDARRLSGHGGLVFVCGRFEGFDERIRAYVDEELSLGDFVLLGGEVAAMAMTEAIVRLLPGVLGNDGSSVEESHGEAELLEYAQYTRPVEFRGARIPEVLLGGNHAAIAKHRSEDARSRTRARRPDLLPNRDVPHEVKPDEKS
jgi:tRNA (guanine37-N1)-methyltransferase